MRVNLSRLAKLEAGLERTAKAHGPDLLSHLSDEEIGTRLERHLPEFMAEFRRLEATDTQAAFALLKARLDQ